MKFKNFFEKMEAKNIVNKLLKKTLIGVNQMKKLLKFSKKKCKEKMRNFNILKNKLELLGLHQPDSNDKSKILKYKCPAILFYLGLITILLGIPICSLRTIKEFVIGCFGFLVFFVMFCVTVLLYYRAPTIYSLTDNFKEVIQKREFKKKYFKKYS